MKLTTSLLCAFSLATAAAAASAKIPFQCDKLCRLHNCDQVAEGSARCKCENEKAVKKNFCCNGPHLPSYAVHQWVSQDHRTNVCDMYEAIHTDFIRTAAIKSSLRKSYPVHIHQTFAERITQDLAQPPTNAGCRPIQSRTVLIRPRLLRRSVLDSASLISQQKTFLMVRMVLSSWPVQLRSSPRPAPPASSSSPPLPSLRCRFLESLHLVAPYWVRRNLWSVLKARHALRTQRVTLWRYLIHQRTYVWFYEGCRAGEFSLSRVTEKAIIVWQIQRKIVVNRTFLEENVKEYAWGEMGNESGDGVTIGRLL